MAVNNIPTRLLLAVVRDGGGRWETCRALLVEDIRQFFAAIA